MRYRSKPVIIEAVQMTKQRLFDWQNDVERVPNGLGVTDHGVGYCCWSRNGKVVPDVDDWIIQESDGSGCYPCKPDVFAAKYEPLT